MAEFQVRPSIHQKNINNVYRYEHYYTYISELSSRLSKCKYYLGLEILRRLNDILADSFIKNCWAPLKQNLRQESKASPISNLELLSHLKYDKIINKESGSAPYHNIVFLFKILFDPFINMNAENMFLVVLNFATVSSWPQRSNSVIFKMQQRFIVRRYIFNWQNYYKLA